MPTQQEKLQNTFREEFGLTRPSEEHLEKLKTRCSNSSYWFAKLVIGKTAWRRIRFDPDLHLEASRWIDRPSARKLGLMPRDHLKTSLWTIAHTLRRVTKDPEQRLLLINEIEDNASNWLQVMQRVVLESPLYRFFYADRIPDPRKVKWNATELTLVRQHNPPEPTITAIGVKGTTNSRHFTGIHEDDLVGPKAADSPLVMQAAIDQHKQAESLLEEPEENSIVTVGTRWGVRDLVWWMLEHEVDLDYFRLSCWRPDGSPLWPGRFSKEYLERLRIKHGPALFALQYENRCIAQGYTEFPLDWLRYYHFREIGDDTYVVLQRPADEGGPKIYHLDQLEKFEMIDPGYNPESKDARTAVVVVGITPEEPYSVVVLDTFARAVSVHKVQEHAWDLWRKWRPLLAGIEVVAAQKDIYYTICQRYPNMMMRQFTTDTHTSKFARIRRLGPLAEQGRLYARRDQADFLEEWETFPNGRTVDILDAFAYGFQIWAAPEGAGDSGEEEYDEEEDERMLGSGRSVITGY